MLVTEEQAREKWCPHARTTMYVRGDMPDRPTPVDLVGHAANRILTDDPEITAKLQAAINETGGTRCLGSACMAWRWDLNSECENGYRHLGWCGAFGRPE